MQKTSTQLKNEVGKVQHQIMPRKSTLDLIKQVARAYNNSRMMSNGLRGYALN